MNEGLQSDLIAAVATAPGQGGIGVVRLSGPGAYQLACQMLGRNIKPRVATFADFRDGEEIVDQGLALYFQAGASFTGEEVVELQGHGGPVVLQRILELVCRLGARLARPGEFSERAFLNGNIDLAQAEAIADLIASRSVTAARAAMRSLQGEFSNHIHTLESELAGLRVLVEACIDFPDEDVEVLEDAQVEQRVQALVQALSSLKRQSYQGRLLNEGASVALIGAPNAGKSSLLNVLAEEEAAIVTDVPGTTRDVLKLDLVLDGLPLRLVDTAGLRSTDDTVERLGVQRARDQARDADLLLAVIDGGVMAQPLTLASVEQAVETLLRDLEYDGQVLVVVNKQDLLKAPDPELLQRLSRPGCLISATNGSGLPELRRMITTLLGFQQQEAGFTARARHLQALGCAEDALREALAQLKSGHSTEVMAEELRVAHLAMGEIVGTVTPDDLLGRIFSEFCIGK